MSFRNTESEYNGLLIVETMILSGQFGLWVLGKPYALGRLPSPQ